MRWIRLDVSWDDSPWLFVLSEGAQLAWVKLLCHVKRDGVAGRCKAMPALIASRRWGVGEESVVKMLQAAQDDGALLVDGQDWVLVNWKHFQEVDQTNYERQRRFRERQRQASSANGNDNGDNGVTPVVNRSHCRVTETLTETLTETETRKKKEPTVPKKSAAAPLPSSFWERFRSSYPKRSGSLEWAKGEQKFLSLVKAGTDPSEIISGVERYRKWCDATGKTGTELVKQVPSFLNSKAWLEEFEAPNAQQNGKPKDERSFFERASSLPDARGVKVQ